MKKIIITPAKYKYKYQTKLFYRTPTLEDKIKFLKFFQAQGFGPKLIGSGS